MSKLIVQKIFRLFLCLTLVGLVGQVAKARDIREIRTPHFYVIFDASQRELANTYADLAELALERLKPQFPERPDKIVLVIDDQTDLANAFATYFPYPIITALPVLPSDDGALSEYTDWAYELLVHELTHILAFEPTHGFYRPLRWIFGSLLKPNALLPAWYHEGLAVEMETRHSNGGRLRSQYYKAYLRAQVEEGSLRSESIDRINESSIPSWPFGARPYLYGAWIWQEALRRKGPELVDRLQQRYSRRIPFFIDGPLREEMKMDWAQLLSEAYVTLEEKALKELSAIRSQGVYEGVDVGLPQINQRSQAISPNGLHLAFVGTDLLEGTGIWLLSRDSTSKEFSSKAKLLKKTNATLQISWLPDSQGFIYEEVVPHKRQFSFYDLFRYDLKEDETEQLTFGRRARHPGVSPAGKWITYVTAKGSSNSLAIADLKNLKEQIIYNPPPLYRLTHPQFLNGRRILFTERNPQGLENFKVIDLKTKRTETAFPSLRQARAAKKVNKGVLLLAGSSGTNNVYFAASENGSPKPFSNTSTYISDVDQDPKSGDLYLSKLTARGPRLFRSLATASEPSFPITSTFLGSSDDSAADSKQKDTPTASASGSQQSDTPHASAADSQQNDTPNATAPTQKENTQKEESDYAAIEYLWPKYWMPLVFFAEGGVLFQASTSASDPTRRHSYALDASIDSLTDRLGWGAAYSYRHPYVSFSMSAANDYDYYAAIDRTIERQGYFANLGLPVPFLSESWAWRFGWEHRQNELSRGYLIQSGPVASLGYASFKQRPIGVAPYGGGAFSVFYNRYLEGPGNIEYDRYGGVVSKYLPSFWPRHSWLLQSKAIVAPADKINKPNNIFLGASTSGGNYLFSVLNTSLLMRGYPSGQFLGAKLYNFNLEYYFPISDIYKGNGTSPLFLRQLSGAIVGDGLSMNGFYYNTDLKGYVSTKPDKLFWSTGLEFKLNTTLAYHLPVNFILGLYYGLDSKAGGGFTTFLTFSFNQFEGINKENLGINKINWP